jgi:curved DNA-binding protein CbpA
MMTTHKPEEPERASPKSRRRPKLLPGITDPYVVLGLERDASQAEIRRTYFDLVRQYPPEQEPQTFKIIRAAYEKLRTPEVRAETDLFLLQAPPARPAPPAPPAFDLAFHPEDALSAVRHWGDLSRTDFSDDFREVEV